MLVIHLRQLVQCIEDSLQSVHPNTVLTQDMEEEDGVEVPEEVLEE
jgi:hypothetical protein